MPVAISSHAVIIVMFLGPPRARERRGVAEEQMGRGDARRDARRDAFPQIVVPKKKSKNFSGAREHG